MRKTISLTLLLLAAPATAQQITPTPTAAYDRAIAAGYKAATLCSAMFIAGRPQAAVEALELTGIYPEYDALLPQLPATIDRQHVTVEVPFDPALPPRSATLGAESGCLLGPIGGQHLSENGSGDLKGLHPIAPKPADPRKWPLGDATDKRKPDAVLNALVDTSLADGYGKGTRTTGVVVVKGGAIVAEKYASGFGPYVANRTWSVAKSISGTLVGVVGGMVPDAPAKIPEWSASEDPRHTITLDNLLRMASGLHSDAAGNRTDAIYFGGTAVDEQTPFWPIEAKPGTRFRYANNDILLAIYAMRKTIGDDRYGDLARRTFDRIGMTHTVAEKDWHGNYILSSQVWSTARDLARFGMLYAQDGLWNGERILPEGWIKYVTTPSGPQPPGEFGYGATFWLMNKSIGVPADTFAAFGNRGQYVVIVPSRNIVIVRRGEDPTGARFDVAKFTADILAVMK